MSPDVKSLLLLFLVVRVLEMGKSVSSKEGCRRVVYFFS